MRNPDKPYSIVVGVDGTELGDLAVTQGFDLARERQEAELHAIHVVTDEELDDEEGASHLDRQEHVLRRLPHEAWARLERLARGMHQPPGRLRVSVHVRFGKPAETIHQVAVDYDADLIVVGTHGRRGVEKLVLGSVAEQLIRTARGPVLVVRPNEFATLPKTERVEPRPEHPSQPPPPSSHEPHIYVVSDEVHWTSHGSDTEGPTGVPT